MLSRMDSGATRNKGAHLTILNQFASRQADILVGTQMLAKGIDFPYVTLVGVILADIGLGLPDFRSAETNIPITYSGCWACRPKSIRWRSDFSILSTR